MAIARGDDGPGNTTRRRTIRKPMPGRPEMSGPADAPVQASAPAAAASLTRSSLPGLRLDDLYRLPMPKLFAQAEREGIHEHAGMRSEEHTSELQSLRHLVCRLLLEKKNKRLHITVQAS